MGGLKVNVMGGVTGAGKTSLIKIMAGGMETQAHSSSSTKGPTVYIFKFASKFKFQYEGAGEEYAVLDTPGLCDAAAEADQNYGLQELSIRAVAATIKMYDLKLMSFLMCLDMPGFLQEIFSEVWP